MLQYVCKSNEKYPASLSSFLENKTKNLRSNFLKCIVSDKLHNVIHFRIPVHGI